ncbi:hypothetical protein TNCT_385571 [Trichonephila clavata]|uniref:Uncharacterized protein n=1 Tax=Trichonephila clavata TaxID=2740835 RepID=A0A8X6HYT9_TRICU|nr:hypothetical protein TNCT_385571 [Trichonephila clavata]
MFGSWIKSCSKEKQCLPMREKYKASSTQKVVPQVMTSSQMAKGFLVNTNTETKWTVNPVYRDLKLNNTA